MCSEGLASGSRVLQKQVLLLLYSRKERKSINLGYKTRLAHRSCDSGVALAHGHLPLPGSVLCADEGARCSHASKPLSAAQWQWRWNPFLEATLLSLTRMHT